MKNLFFLLTAFLFPLMITAQPNIQWQVCLGGSDDEIAYAISETVDAGYIVAGYSESSDGDVSVNNGNKDFWIVKLDQSGNLLWEKSFGGSNDEQAMSIQQTSDQGYIAAGFTLSNNGDVSGNHGNEDVWIVKLDSAGTMQWQKCLGGSGADHGYEIKELSGGGYIVAGSTASNNGDVSGNHGLQDFWLVRLNNTGGIVWQQCYGGSENDIAQSLHVISGGYLILGYTYSNNGDVSGNHGLYDSWLIKVDQNGSLLWQNCLGGSGFEYHYSVTETSTSDILVAGSTGSNDGDVNGNHNSGGFGYSYDQWVVLLDSSGNIQWQKCLGGTDQDISFAVRQTSDDNFISGGNAWSINGDVSGNHGSSDFWLVKLDANANMLWQKCLGGSSFDMGRDVHQTMDGGYIMTGFTSSNNGDVSGHHGLYDIWVVKLEAETTVLPVELISFYGMVNIDDITLRWITQSEIDHAYFTIERSGDGQDFEPIGKVAGSGSSDHRFEYSFIDENPVTGINYYRLRQVDRNGSASLSGVIALDFHVKQTFGIFPNPARDILYVSLSEVDADLTYEIFGSSGALIHRGSISGKLTEIDISSWEKGFYYLRISGGNTFYGIRKLAVH